MDQENRQKIKLVHLLEILRQCSDEQNPMRKDEIIAKLAEHGIQCNVKTLSRDIRLLNENGYEIMSVMLGHEKAYYIADRSFSVPELRILIDAVEAASFITEKKTAELTEKIANLGGSNFAALLTENRVLFNTRKHQNESIYYNVNALEDAIRRKHTASFRYFDLDEHHARRYRKRGARYEVEPLALIYLDDNYYLMCYSSKYRGLCNYRVDRMDQVQMEETPISNEAAAEMPDLGAYTAKVFRMYGGKTERIKLRFTNDLIAPIYDKFGEDAELRRVDEDTLELITQVETSPTFWGWLFQFADKMQIVYPKRLLRTYRKRAQSIIDEADTKSS